MQSYRLAATADVLDSDKHTFDVLCRAAVGRDMIPSEFYLVTPYGPRPLGSTGIAGLNLTWPTYSRFVKNSRRNPSCSARWVST